MGYRLIAVGHATKQSAAPWLRRILPLRAPPTSSSLSREWELTRDSPSFGTRCVSLSLNSDNARNGDPLAVRAPPIAGRPARPSPAARRPHARPHNPPLCVMAAEGSTAIPELVHALRLVKTRRT